MSVRGNEDETNSPCTAASFFYMKLVIVYEK
jgi:hypothetical protein